MAALSSSWPQVYISREAYDLFLSVNNMVPGACRTHINLDTPESYERYTQGFNSRSSALRRDPHHLVSGEEMLSKVILLKLERYLSTPSPTVVCRQQ